MSRVRRSPFYFLALLTVFLVACGGGERLDARVLELSVTYSAQGPVLAEMHGDRGAVTGGATVECRLTAGEKPVVGQATANQFGAFEMTLDHTQFPDRLPSADEFATYNETIECRPRGGSWENPLKQPVVRVS